MAYFDLAYVIIAALAVLRSQTDMMTVRFAEPTLLRVQQ
jgi:hypothetical protein